jgi:hypothetical protein
MSLKYKRKIQAMFYGIKKMIFGKLTSYKLHQESFDAHLYLDDDGWCQIIPLVFTNMD